MEDEQAAPSGATVTTPFPEPPPFYTFFTPDRIADYEARTGLAPGVLALSDANARGDVKTDLGAGDVKADLGNGDPKAHLGDGDPKANLDNGHVEAQLKHVDLPPELQPLRPPTPPVDGRYRSFGELRSINDPNPAPAPTFDPPLPTNPSALRDVTRALLLNFLELLTILSVDAAPSAYGPKWEDLRDLFVEASRILAAYRPWQARQALIHLMEDMLARGQAEGERLRQAQVELQRVLQDVAKAADNVDDSPDVSMENSSGKQDSKALRENAGSGAQRTNLAHVQRADRRIWETLDAMPTSTS